MRSQQRTLIAMLAMPAASWGSRIMRKQCCGDGYYCYYYLLCPCIDGPGYRGNGRPGSQTAAYPGLRPGSKPCSRPSMRLFPPNRTTMFRCRPSHASSRRLAAVSVARPAAAEPTRRCEVAERLVLGQPKSQHCPRGRPHRHIQRNALGAASRHWLARNALATRR